MAYRLEKNILKKKYGKKCMLCFRRLKDKECTFHHIVPKSFGGTTDINNGALLCKQCQTIIHLFNYKEDGYKKLTNKILKNKHQLSNLNRY